jgi:hypothetical protein
LRESRLLKFEAVSGDSGQSIVVYDYTAIGIEDKSLQGEQAVVRLDDDIIVIGEH